MLENKFKLLTSSPPPNSSFRFSLNMGSASDPGCLYHIDSYEKNKHRKNQRTCQEFSFIRKDKTRLVTRPFPIIVYRFALIISMSY